MPWWEEGHTSGQFSPLTTTEVRQCGTHGTHGGLPTWAPHHGTLTLGLAQGSTYQSQAHHCLVYIYINIAV